MRIALELDKAASDALTQLEVSTGMSVSRIFSYALSLMLWAFGQGAKGRIVASVDESQRSYRELELATLEQKEICAA